MGERHDYVALEWVTGEIAETLKQARQELEAFAEDSSDLTRMRFCQTYIHQVVGTLQMVEFYGAALLAEEMEALASALQDVRLKNAGEAQEVLMQAILQLPSYLDHVQTGRRETPAVLLPILNDLRAARGEKLLTETAMFKPDLGEPLAAASPALMAKLQAANFPVLAKKLRQTYQYALVNLVRGQDQAQCYSYLDKVVRRLETISKQTPCYPLWWSVAGLVEALSSEALELSASVRGLLRQLDQQFKLLQQHGPAALNRPAPEELLKNILYYLSKCPPSSARLQAIHSHFKLAEALPDEQVLDRERAQMRGPDRETMGSVVSALMEELVGVKDALDLYVRNPQRDPAALEAQLPVIKRIGDTMAVLGLGSPRKVLAEQQQLLEQMLRSGKPADDGQLMDIAGGLLYVEATLSGIVEEQADSANGSMPLREIARVHEAVLREARNALEQAKEALVEFINSKWDHRYLEPAPELLRSVRGGFAMIPLPRAAQIIERANAFIVEELLEQRQEPDWNRLELLADAITSVDYYLDRLAEEHPQQGDVLLDVAEESLAALGFGVAAEALRAEPVAEAEAEAEQTAAFESQPSVAEEHIEIEAPVSPAVDEDYGYLPLSEDAPEDAPLRVVEDDEDDLIDDELIEIFIEEAGEVLESLDEQLPRWQQNRQDQDALTSIRRSFHTLKGSGRMVKAMVIGELAWAIENMLNRVLDQTIDADDALVDLVGRVVAYTPELVTHYQQRRQHMTPVVEALTAEAEAYARGEPYLAAEGLTSDVLAPVADTEAVCSEQDPIEIDSESAEQPVDDGDGHGAAVSEAGDGEAWSLDEMLLSEDAQDVAVAETLTEEPADDGVDEDLLLYEVPIFEEAEDGDEQSECVSAEAAGSIEDQDAPAVFDAWIVAEDDAEFEPVSEIIEEPVAELAPDSVDVADESPVAEAEAEFELDEETASLCVDALQTESADAERVLAAAESEDEEEIDPVLLEIFRQEAQGHLQVVAAFIQSWQERGGLPLKISDELQRALHTLKGSAHMAGITPIAEVGTPLEKMIKEFRAHQIEADTAVIDLLQRGHTLIAGGVAQMAAGQPVSLEDVDDYLDALDQLTRERLQSARPDQEELRPSPQQVSIFLAEGMELLLEASDLLADWRQQPDSLDPLLSLQAELDTVARGAMLADLQPISMLAEVMSAAYQQVLSGALEPGAAFLDLMAAGHEQLVAMMDQVAAQQTLVPATALMMQIQALEPGLEQEEILLDQVEPLEEMQTQFTLGAAAESDENHESESESESESEAAMTSSVADVPPAAAEEPELDPELVEIFLEEAEDILDSAGQGLQQWLDQPDDLSPLQGLQRELHTLKGGARMAEIAAIGDLSHELEFLYEGIGDGRYTAQPALFDLLLACHDRLADMVDDLKAGRPCTPATALQEAIALFRKAPDAGVPSWQGSVAQNAPVAAIEEPVAEAAPVEPVDAEPAQERATAEARVEPVASIVATAEQPASAALDEQLQTADRDILEIFVDEASELVEQIDQNLHSWRREPETAQYPDALMRLLHTLKGGARLAGLAALGDLSHDYEQHIGQGRNLGQFDNHFFVSLLGYQDRLIAQVDQVLGYFKGARDAAEAAMVAAVSTAESGAETVQAETQPPVPLNAVTAGMLEAQAPSYNQWQAQQQKLARQKGPQEMVRVPAELLESLVNLAGETSITRGRVEQQVSDFGFTLEEMHATIDRLREQLRRLDIETQAQILSKYEAEHGANPDFDPLEMDQYSELTQLSRSLVESATDLLDLKQGLSEKTRDAETLLLQQSRVNSELQEGLMRTRMVPFSRLLPRLRRIVRQVSGELGKQVEFLVNNAEGEMDRTVLERMVAPLEHMLRNAVDHGIEDRVEVRQAAGKAPVGKIQLDLRREGGDIVLELSDDGAGINVEAVRAKAIERGLIAPNADLTDHEITQFIMNAGFSTASQVTQISGRGVGMDVVSAEIKQLGGSMSIHSEPGQGTRFEVRLPFTVSVNRALMVYLGDDLYAIPLNTIEGIVRVSPYELESYYENPEHPFSYAGQDYELRYLGELLHNRKRTASLGGAPVPVVLARGADHAVALEVDTLAGSREIVVKSLGAQFGSVTGISGATILGDGRVVVILDLVAMIRAAYAQRSLPQPEQEAAAALPATAQREQPLVMVVDDSVTVRKVTSRLLERNGFEVLTAKDGVDAVALLQENRPDAMLLDIEMPRMDGFEVATFVRNDEGLRNVPIIMITSRTGEKHRERAMAIGVNEYMGKPFQEAELLATLERLVHADG